jgi:ribosomal protein S18 acetylase RimI-like enzyme
MSDVRINKLEDGEDVSDEVVTLLATVFDDKREILLGNKPGWKKIVESLLSEYSGVIYVAEVDGSVGGAAVFRFKEWNPGKRTINTVISQLGILGSIVANRKLKKLAKSLPELEEGEVMVDALGVVVGHRRKGTAIELLKKGEDWARLQGKSSMCLSVKADNQAALALYKKIGYVIVHPYKNIFGDNYHMRKQL